MLTLLKMICTAKFQPKAASSRVHITRGQGRRKGREDEKEGADIRVDAAAGLMGKPEKAAAKGLQGLWSGTRWGIPGT